jgi:hypothetical protein
MVAPHWIPPRSSVRPITLSFSTHRTLVRLHMGFGTPRTFGRTLIIKMATAMFPKRRKLFSILHGIFRLYRFLLYVSVAGVQVMTTSALTSGPPQWVMRSDDTHVATNTEVPPDERFVRSRTDTWLLHRVKGSRYLASQSADVPLSLINKISFSFHAT